MEKIRNYALALLLAPLIVLAGCASNTWSESVAAVQAGWPVVEAAVNTDLGTPSAAVAKAEAAITADVNALSGTSAPNSLTTVANDVGVLVSALPPNVVSPQHVADLKALVATADVAGLVF